jgi:hypothetical protein
MAGTTGLEPVASAVTVSGLQVLSTTWKSTDGTTSHWKYVVDNVNVYRDVYRVLPERCSGLWGPQPQRSEDLREATLMLFRLILKS